MAMNPNLTYMLSKVQAVSTQTFKLQPQNSTSAVAGTQVRIALPSNTLLNLRSIKMFFNAYTAGTRTRLPPKIESLIDRVELQAGGVTVDGGELQEYGLLSHAKSSIMGDKSSALSHPEMVRVTSYHTGSAFPSGNEVYLSDSPFVVSDWNGFLGSCQPGIIDTGLLPDLTLVITMASNKVLSSSAGTTMSTFVQAGAGDGSYTIENIRLTCECLGLGSGVYDQLVSRAIQERGMIELPFTQYNSTIDTHNGSTRFSVSCASLDRIWVAFRPSTYMNSKAPIKVSGFKTPGGETSDSKELGLPGYDHGGVMATNEEKYISEYFNCEIDANATAQFQLNGSMTPGFQASVAEWMEISKNAVSGVGMEAKDMKTLDQYRDNYAVICHRLCLPGAGPREQSGLDTRGINLSGSLNTTGVAAGSNVVVFCEMKSVLQIGANKQFSIVK